MRRSARVASTHEKFGSGRRRARRTPRATPSSGRGGRGSPAGPPSTRSTPKRHRHAEQPDEAHVVVQREPRHDHVVLGQPGGGDDGVEVGAEHAVGQHHALRLAGRAAGVLQDDQALRIGRRQLEGIGRTATGARLHGGERARPAGHPARARRTGRAGRRSGAGRRRRGGSGPGSIARTPRWTPSASAAAAPWTRRRRASTAWMVVTRARVVGPRMATWSPGATPRACSAAATARASSWTWAQGSCTRSPPLMKVTVRPLRSAARSRREVMGLDMRNGVLGEGNQMFGPVKQKVGFTLVPATDPSDDTPKFRYTASLAGEIESHWQDLWDREGTFEAPNPAGPLAQPEKVAGRPKLFVLDMFPYPSGAGLHVGPPARVHRHRRLRPLQAHDRPQRAARHGFRRLRPARRAARRPDRHPPARQHRAEHRHVPAAAAPSGPGP